MSDQSPLHNCPNCGHALDLRIAASKVAGCAACGSTVFLNDRSFRAPGEAGDMHVAPSLLQLGQPVRLGKTTATPIGVIRYSYGRGWWDEYWCVADDAPFWVSVDEGDIVVEKPTNGPEWPASRGHPKLGDSIKYVLRTYEAVEVETATCVAFRGELPEAPEVGEEHHFVNFLSGSGQALSLEIWGNNRAWFEGQWIDPWDVGAA
ncbi:MAG: DUF4178 domain-containing protein [Pikeienuella sp.]